MVPDCSIALSIFDGIPSDSVSAPMFSVSSGAFSDGCMATTSVSDAGAFSNAWGPDEFVPG